MLSRERAMIEGAQPQAAADEPPMSRAEKLAAKRANERVKLVSSFFHSIALASVGLLGLRLLLDPTAQPPSFTAVVIGCIGMVASEAFAFYILGLMRPEA